MSNRYQTDLCERRGWLLQAKTAEPSFDGMVRFASAPSIRRRLPRGRAAGVGAHGRFNQRAVRDSNG